MVIALDKNLMYKMRMKEMSKFYKVLEIQHNKKEEIVFQETVKYNMLIK